MVNDLLLFNRVAILEVGAHTLLHSIEAPGCIGGMLYTKY
jgi:hypothetical protein